MTTGDDDDDGDIEGVGDVVTCSSPVSLVPLSTRIALDVVVSCARWVLTPPPPPSSSGTAPLISVLSLWRAVCAEVAVAVVGMKAAARTAAVALLLWLFGQGALCGVFWI